MHGTTTEAIAVLLTFLLMAGLGVALLVVALKVSPRASQRRVSGIQLRRPGKRSRGGMYVVAALHVLAGIIIAAKVPGAGFSIVLVCVAAAAIYALMAESYALMLRIGRVSDDR